MAQRRAGGYRPLLAVAGVRVPAPHERAALLLDEQVALAAALQRPTAAWPGSAKA